VIEQTYILWGFGLLLASIALVGIEVFVPSGGVIGIVAFLLAVAAVVAFWMVSWVWGTISLLIVLILAPLSVNFALRIMPTTPMGRHLILSGDDEEATQQALREQERFEHEQALVGATGVAITDLRPIGAARIEGTRVEVMAEGGPIDAGSAVRVTAVNGNQVRVRAVG
jgi:membrane-bound ClpP family serine protease